MLRPATLLFSLALLCIAPLCRAAEGAPGGKRDFIDLPYVANGLPSQRLDLFLPESSSGPAPLVVFIHGGGWQKGTKSSTPAKYLLPQGYAVASVEYRFSQVAVFPAQIEDCKAALRWLRAHAAEYNLDAKHVAVWGGSAGGHLVSLLGVTGHTRDFDKGDNLDQTSEVQAVVDWFGPADFEHWGDKPDSAVQKANNAVAALLGGPIGTKLELARQASPVTYVSKDSAPFLIMHGSADPLVPIQQSVLLDSLLKKAGVESTLKILSGAKHGGPEFTTPESQILIADFLKKHLKQG